MPHLSGAEARKLGVVEEVVHALHALRLLENRADAPARERASARRRGREERGGGRDREGEREKKKERE